MQYGGFHVPITQETEPAGVLTPARVTPARWVKDSVRLGFESASYPHYRNAAQELFQQIA